MILVEENTKDELKEKFILLREAYDDLKGEYSFHMRYHIMFSEDMIRLDFEVDCLKDDQDEREEEVCS